MERISITIRGQHDRDRVADLAKTLAVGMRVEVKDSRRTPEQNDLMWPRLRDVADQVEWYGEKLTVVDWKDMFTASLRRARIVRNIDGDGFVQLGLHTSDLTKDEMSNLLDLMDAFAAERGVKFKETNSDSSDTSTPGNRTDAPAGSVGPQPESPAGVSNSDSSGGNRQADQADAPAGIPQPPAPPAGATNFASLLSDDWRDVYIVQLTGPTTKAMSIQTRDHNALQMIGGTPNEIERQWMRQVATLANKRDKGKLKTGEFESELARLRGAA